MFAGSVASLTVLGAPDLIVLTLSPESASTRHIDPLGRGADLPIMTDADHGYGNALNVMRTVEDWRRPASRALDRGHAAAAALRSGGKPALISIEEGVGKMKAACASRQGSRDCGRTSAVAITGFADAVARAKAYEAAGVDACSTSA